MPGIHVVTDSACDLTPAMVEERNVRVVPLTIRFGSEEFVDRVELSGKEFWDRVVTSDVVPETAAPSPGAFQQAFEAAADGGATGVVCINLSSRLSATYQSATAAAQAVHERIPVSVVDSLSVTGGLGLLVVAAADMAAAGCTLDEIVGAVEDLRSRSEVFGVVGTLDYLKKGGRIGGAAHLVGSLLSIKPVITVQEGAVEVESKQRTRSRALRYVIDKATDAAPLERLAVAVGAATDADELVDDLSKVPCDTDMFVTELGPVVGSHTGPGTIGVCFQRKR